MRKPWAWLMGGTLAAGAVAAMHWPVGATPAAPGGTPSSLRLLPATLVSESAQGSLNIPNMASSNWAGLIQSGSQETSVSATWTTPSNWTGVTVPGASVGAWVGLGGVNSSQLIQIGTITSPDNEGNPVTTAFWEVLPANATLTATIPAGTTVTATISPASYDAWRLSLTSPGRPTPWAVKTVTLTPAQAKGIETSADWITEQVSTSGNRLLPLAPFGNLTMSNLSAKQVPLSQIPASTLQGSLLVNHVGLLEAAPTYNPTNPNAITVSETQASPVSVGDFGYSPNAGYPPSYAVGSNTGGVGDGYSYSNAIPGGGRRAHYHVYRGRSGGVTWEIILP